MTGKGKPKARLWSYNGEFQSSPIMTTKIVVNPY
jgi:hypothetical protein